jgi:predicted homoserine dehydrogenase-like protein
MAITFKLRELQKSGGYIRVGLIGAGQMGRGMISQIESMQGMRVVATADIRADYAKHAYLHAGVKPEEIIQTDRIETAERAIRENKVVVTERMELVMHCAEVDVIVDATGVPNIGAEIAYTSILQKKHVVMLNVETDVTVGLLLSRTAKSAGTVYTGSAGDEPGAVMELYHFAEALGFETVAIGKGKNNPLNVEANPDSAREGALQVGANPKMIASFQDGTKTMIEMTAVANATGFIPDVPGMSGPTATVKELPDLYRLRSEGGILNQKKVVDYVNGVAPGVFVIVTSSKAEVRDEMKYLKMGDGPNYVLFRPYHLTSLETPLSIAKAYFYKEETIVGWHGHVAETVAVAKRDLQQGEKLDGLGGFTTYGKIMTAGEAEKMEALPIGLVHPSQVVKKPVKKGEILTYGDIENTEDLIIWELRRLQAKVIGKALTL